MRKILVLLFLFVACGSVLRAQNQITVSGKILNMEANKEGKRNLPFTDELVEVFSYATKADAEEALKLME